MQKQLIELNTNIKSDETILDEIHQQMLITIEELKKAQLEIGLEMNKRSVHETIRDR